MTLRESLIEHYITQPMAVRLNGCDTDDLEVELKPGDVVWVNWPHVGIRQWTIGEPKA